MSNHTRGDKSRIIKRKFTPRKDWTEAVKEKIVQFFTYKQLLCGPFTDKPKSSQNAALQEALECTGCKHLHIIPYMMNADIAAGSYITSEYPPFFASKSVSDEHISPFDTDTAAYQNNNTTFWGDITSSQQHYYYNKIDSILKKAEAESGKPTDEATVLFAHYQVDFHIRQHYLAPQSILNLCRSKDDVRALNYWQWRTAAADETAFEDVPGWGVGWVHEPSNSIGHQIAAWRKGERKREKHLAEVKARWAEINEERQKQRTRTIKITFKGTHIRTHKYEPCEPPLTEKEIVRIAREKGAYAEAFLDCITL
ncbi:uncharacterized protein N7479_005537 [Penicillium vulpinum]|uniref:Uncharacterized protein n=1 Tax=Penicillium vulpinum TaxID=29845 RepID=A0A1V6SDM3_9EURO|nr:uncharacterized protein N7479_005537 [Penicillium vulpinum]KAJ5958387.1 hypothetical protein N7479_005537 [Penicillium vulpinum]OQE12122.1 hypothetical protein PENVUL_c001G10056 [Penicillium vulpinum]